MNLQTYNFMAKMWYRTDGNKTLQLINNQLTN